MTYTLQIEVRVTSDAGEEYQVIEREIYASTNSINVLRQICETCAGPVLKATSEAWTELRNVEQMALAQVQDEIMAAQAERDRASNGPEWTEGLGDDEDDDQ